MQGRVERFIDAMDREVSAAGLSSRARARRRWRRLRRPGRPSILIPLPTATDDHQRKNARGAASGGAAEVIDQKDLTGERAGEPGARARRAIARTAPADGGGGAPAREAATPRNELWTLSSELAERRRLVSGVLERAKRIHFIGIGGIGMSGIAELLVNLGYEVSGSDMQRTDITTRLESLGARIAEGHDAQHVGDAEVVVYSSAVQADQPRDGRRRANGG